MTTPNAEPVNVKKSRLYRVKLNKNHCPQGDWEPVELKQHAFHGVGSEIGGTRVWKGSTIKVELDEFNKIVSSKIGERADAPNPD